MKSSFLPHYATREYSQYSEAYISICVPFFVPYTHNFCIVAAQTQVIIVCGVIREKLLYPSNGAIGFNEVAVVCSSHKDEVGGGVAVQGGEVCHGYVQQDTQLRPGLKLPA